ncbi:MAG: nicotinate-nucleotide adenylyltransferase [Firmicutes bacterium]|nr:nicotinate-nucleotide adenylyltransferase [Bacillota bacterium]
MQRIGIFGGSFDPVHLGHVNLAKDALNQCALDQVLLVPARLQPFKLDRQPASGSDRMNMLDLALAGEERIHPSDLELKQEGVSYTYLTLRAMQKQFGEDARLYFIVGTDSLVKLDTWMNHDELLTRYAYIVGSRPGYRDEELEEAMRRLTDRWGTEILRIENRPFDLSATEIRQRIAQGLPVTDMVGPEVEEYIRTHGLYR